LQLLPKVPAGQRAFFYLLHIVIQEFAYLNGELQFLKSMARQQSDSRDVEELRRRHQNEELEHDKAATTTQIVVLVVILGIVGSLAYYLST